VRLSKLRAAPRLISEHTFFFSELGNAVATGAVGGFLGNLAQSQNVETAAGSAAATAVASGVAYAASNVDIGSTSSSDTNAASGDDGVASTDNANSSSADGSGDCQSTGEDSSGGTPILNHFGISLPGLANVGILNSVVSQRVLATASARALD
jgi:hypothetical protein